MKHGYIGYTKSKCRCEICTEANTLRSRQQRAAWRTNGKWPPLLVTRKKNNGLCTKCGKNERSWKDCRCKQCRSSDWKKWELENPEKAKLSGMRRMERYRNDPVFRAGVLLKHRTRYSVVRSIRQRTRRLKTYNITPLYHDAVLRIQGNKCAVCEIHETEQNRILSMDHNHRTGTARGFLCDNCNHGLGHFKDNPELLHAATDYLEAYSLQEQVA